MKLKQLLFMLICAMFATNFYAADIYVSASGINSADPSIADGSPEKPYATIVYAYPLAVSGDVIKVVGTLSSVNAQVLLSGGTPNRSITIEGTDATATIADYNAVGRSFLINTAGYTGTITFRNLIFLNNISSNTSGGSVFFNSQAGATVNFENCTFTGNSNSSTAATNGGGAIAMTNGTLTITNCSFSANTTAGELGGGAIYITGATNSTITGTTFYNNTTTNALGKGGAINFNNTGTTTNSITNCTFFENKVAQTANFHGAAIRVNSALTTTSVTVSNSLFYNNLSHSGGVGSLPSDFNGPGQPTMSFTNSLGQYGNNIDITTGSIINNGGVAPMNIGANISSSNLAWNGTLNKVTFSAPPSILNNTPIDFGSDNNDVGAWDSKINLFKGTTDSDWATGSNWSSTAIPTSLENVTLLSDSPALVLSGSTNATINNLSVDAASSLTINSGGVLIVNGTSTGNVTYKRNLGTTNWYLVSAPVNGEDMTDMRANNTFADGSGGGRIGFAPYLTSGNSWSYFTTSSTDALIAGIGYSAKLASAGDLSFTGTINTADVSVAVANTGTGFNLIGNPFTSHLNSATFLTDNSDNLVSQTLWVWDGSTYDTKVTGESFVLAPGQGFFVRSNNGTNLNIAESYQASTGGTFQKSAKTEVKLMMNDGSNNRFAKLYYLDNATKGFDNGFDGETFGGIENTVDVFTNLVANNEGKKYQVQSLPLAEMETMIVLVGVKAAAGKEISFTAEALNLPNDLKVFLEDRLTNTFTRLDEANSSYKVTLNDALNGTGRFFLHTKASGVLSTDEVVLQNTSIYAINNNTLRVVGLPSGNANVKMYSILGKQVMSTSFSSTGVKDISLPKLSTGMYIIQLETATGKLNKKIVLE
jgi:hypothetical protein